MRETTAIPNTIMYLPTIIQPMRETTAIPNNNIPLLSPQPNRHPLQVFTAKWVKGTTTQFTKAPHTHIVPFYKNSHSANKIKKEKIIEPKVSLAIHQLLPKLVPHISISKVTWFFRLNRISKGLQQRNIASKT